MTTSQIIASAPTMPVFVTGSRVSWQGIPATVIDGNEPSEWVGSRPVVSLHLDRPVKRGFVSYADVNAASLTAL